MFNSGFILVLFSHINIRVFLPTRSRDLNILHYLTFQAGSTENGSGGFCGFKRLEGRAYGRAKTSKGEGETPKVTMII